MYRCGPTSFTSSLVAPFPPACERPCRLFEQAVIRPTDTVSGLTAPCSVQHYTHSEGEKQRKTLFTQHRHTEERIDEPARTST